MKITIEQSDKFAKTIYKNLTSLWKTVNKTDLKAADGRKKDAPPYATKGSFLYVAYENDCVLYVGETSISIRSRFHGDGSGSHSKKGWYHRVTHIKYIKKTYDALPEKNRKLLEQALSLELTPEFYGRSKKAQA